MNGVRPRRNAHPGTREKLKSLSIHFVGYQISEEDLWIKPGLLPETDNTQEPHI